MATFSGDCRSAIRMGIVLSAMVTRSTRHNRMGRKLSRRYGRKTIMCCGSPQDRDTISFGCWEYVAPNSMGGIKTAQLEKGGPLLWTHGPGGPCGLHLSKRAL